MIANRFNPLGRKLGFDATSYIQDGLIAQWDGIENAGRNKHSDDIDSWVDLIGNIGDLPLNKNRCVINRNNVEQTSFLPMIDSSVSSSLLPQGAITIEVCARINEFNPNVGGTYYFPALFSLGVDSSDLQFSWNKVEGQSMAFRFRLNTLGTFYANGEWNLTGAIETFFATDIGDTASPFTSIARIDGTYSNSSTYNSRYTRNSIKTKSLREGTGIKANYHRIMIYNRSLSIDEHNFNTHIDKERFGAL